MKTEIEAAQKKENLAPKKENLAPKKEKKATKNSKDPVSAIKNFVGKEVDITMRNGNSLKGKLETVTQYELVITISYTPMIVMKHAIDCMTLAGEK